MFSKGRELYGLFLARNAIRDAGTVVVVEGYMDVVALAQHGVELRGRHARHGDHAGPRAEALPPDRQGRVLLRRRRRRAARRRGARSRTRCPVLARRQERACSCSCPTARTRTTSCAAAARRPSSRRSRQRRAAVRIPARRARRAPSADVVPRAAPRWSPPPGRYLAQIAGAGAGGHPAQAAGRDSGPRRTTSCAGSCPLGAPAEAPRAAPARPPARGPAAAAAVARPPVHSRAAPVSRRSAKTLEFPQPEERTPDAAALPPSSGIARRRRRRRRRPASSRPSPARRTPTSSRRSWRRSKRNRWTTLRSNPR